jgi:hypothetical protein
MSCEEVKGRTGHDQSILYQTESTSDPISLETDQDLAYDDTCLSALTTELYRQRTDNLEIRNGRNPVLVAHLVGGPTFRPYSSIKRAQVTDREQSNGQPRRSKKKAAADSRVTLGEKTETTNNVSLAVCRQGRKGISLEHFSYRLEFPLGLGIRLGVDPFLSCLPW